MGQVVDGTLRNVYRGFWRGDGNDFGEGDLRIWFTGVEGILDAVDGELLVVVYSRYLGVWGLYLSVPLGYAIAANGLKLLIKKRYHTILKSVFSETSPSCNLSNNDLAFP